jgi:hypothetical protein
MFVFFFFSCENKKQSNTQTQKRTDTLPLSAQPENPYSPLDISPMDMSYFPPDYPMLKMTDSISTPPVMRIIYSRPHKQGRIIFGELLKYDENWRLGANEATEIEFFRNVNVQGKKINAGRYIVYCIPFENKWTIIFNSNLYTWGLKIDSKKDLFHFDIPLEKPPVNFEYFTAVFQKTNSGADLVMAWDNVQARLQVNF